MTEKELKISVSVYINHVQDFILLTNDILQQLEDMTIPVMYLTSP